MKKIILLTLIAVCLVPVLIADEKSDDSYFRIDRLLDDELDDNFFRIRNMADDLDFDQKEDLYDEYEKSVAGPLLLNLVVPFGIGSFVQGDVGGGITLAVLDAVTIGTIAYGLVFLTIDYSYDDYGYDNSYTDPSSYIGLGFLLIGATTEIIGVILKIARPIRHAREHNKDLRNALKFDGKYSMTVTPGVDLTSSGDLVPALSMKISY